MGDGTRDIDGGLVKYNHIKLINTSTISVSVTHHHHDLDPNSHIVTTK